MVKNCRTRLNGLLALMIAVPFVSPPFVLAEGVLRLEEVFVTATRRAETDIQATPIAVTLLDSQQINRAVPRDLLDMAAYAPNVSSGKQPGYNAANFAIRGIGQNSIILYYENQVGVVVDDFVIPHIQTANIEMLDIASVEILRGPQGTLFGKNTTAGAISVKTNRPDLQSNTLDVRGKLAQYGRYEGQAIANVAISDTAAFRASGLYMKSDGYYELGAEYGPVVDFFGVGHPLAGTSGRGDGSDYGGDDVFSGRFKLRWQPTEALDLNLAYEVVRDKGDAPPSINGTPAFGYLFPALGFRADGGSPFDRATTMLRDDPLLGRDKGHSVNVDGFYFNLDWSLNDRYILSGFAGHRITDSWLPVTSSGEPTPISLFDVNRQDERETTQLELRLASDLGGSFEWLVGGFYQEDDTVFSAAQFLGFVDFTIPSGQAFGDPLFYNNYPQVLSNTQDASAWAIFADATWNLTDKLSVGAGVRYTEERKQWAGRNSVFVLILDPYFNLGMTSDQLGEPIAAADFERFPAGVVRDRESWAEPTWRLHAGYQATEDLYAYASYSTGFKSGGYTDQTGTGGNPIEPVQARPTDPETADSFELGLRSELMDNKLRMNLTGFWVTYDDSQQQLLATIPADRDGDGFNESEFQETRYFNAAEIEVKGIEFEATWRLTEHLTLAGSVGVLDAEMKKFEADTNFDGAKNIELSGSPVARAPDTTWNLDVLYSLPVTAGIVDIAFNMNYEDEAVFAYTDVLGAPNGMTDERTLVNVSAAFTSADDDWWLRLYAKNLANTEYRIGEYPVASLWVMSFYGEPRTIGLEGGIRFDW